LISDAKRRLKILYREKGIILMLTVNNLTKKYGKLLANDDTSKAFVAVIGILNI